MTTLYDAIKKAIQLFGHEILTERKIVNILSDYGAFATLPTTKTVLKNMVEGGYCQKICDLGKKRSLFLWTSSHSLHKPKGDDWKIRLASLATHISQQEGLDKRVVTYVIDCIIYGLEWMEETPSLTKGDSNSQIVANYNVSPQMGQQVTTGINTNPSNGITYQQIKDIQFVVMNIKPFHAEVFIDGIQQYVSNGVMATELAIGTHNYEIKATSYKSQKGTFTLSANSKTVLNIQLELEEQNIALSIVADDKDADILINGSVCGKGMWNGLVHAGEVYIECTKPKYQSYTEKRVLGAQQKVNIHIPALQPICGNLKINVQPYGSEVFINEKSMGTTPLMVTGMSIGIRAIRITSPEGIDYNTNVEVKEGQVTNVNHIIPSLFLKDYSEVKIGDYFYEDGSISHKLAKGKKAVGLVFSLETSKEEKKQGWTHGQIVALEDAKMDVTNYLTWGIPTKEILRHAVIIPNVIKYMLGVNDKGYKIAHQDCVVNNEDFAPFYIASKYDAPLPFGLTSGWYLPNLRQWYSICENTLYNWDVIWSDLKLLDRSFATSSLVDKNTAWVCKIGYREKTFPTKDIKNYLGKDPKAYRYDKMHVRSVAAF